jgi:hypothetical protein
MASTYHHSELSFHSLSPAPRSFFRSSTRLPDWQSFTAGRVATRVRVEVWDCNASIAKWIGNRCRPHDAHTHTQMYACAGYVQ